MLSRLAMTCVLTVLPMVGWAGPHQDLYNAMRLDELLQVMRNEGVTYGDELASDMFANGGSGSWGAQVSDIYDIDRMRRSVTQGLERSIAEDDAARMTAFFETELGARIIGLEISAREAMTDSEIEQAARAAFHTGVRAEDPKIDPIREYVEVNNLVEANVEGAMNSSYQFYRGLIQGGALDQTEEDILSEIWSTEGFTYNDTEEWVYGFLMLAYGPLAKEELETYTEISKSDAGQALNRSLFVAFNGMYDDISYAMGLAAAHHLSGQDL